VRRDLLTALDYFYTGIQPPKSPKTPADGNPMEEYLYRRQATATFTRGIASQRRGPEAFLSSVPSSAESSRTRWRTFADIWLRVR
jgi:hypothetical protein